MALASGQLEGRDGRGRDVRAGALHPPCVISPWTGTLKVHRPGVLCAQKER
jgi:hypothetical protein